LLKGLILLDPADSDGREIPGGEAAVTAIIDKAMAARREQLAKGPAGAGAGAATGDKETLRMLAEDMRAAPEARLRGSMRSMFTIRSGEAIGRLAMPALVALGDADEIIPVPNMLATWAKLPKGSGLHVWHGVGHSPNVDCPLEVAALVRRFVERTIPAASGR
jgi:pimeloyl-ACP methyl ester carboxylesterase